MPAHLDIIVKVLYLFGWVTWETWICVLCSMAICLVDVEIFHRKTVTYFAVLEEKSEDHQCHQDLTLWHHWYLFQISWQSIKWLLFLSDLKWSTDKPMDQFTDCTAIPQSHAWPENRAFTPKALFWHCTEQGWPLSATAWSIAGMVVCIDFF